MTLKLFVFGLFELWHKCMCFLSTRKLRPHQDMNQKHISLQYFHSQLQSRNIPIIHSVGIMVWCWSPKINNVCMFDGVTWHTSHFIVFVGKPIKTILPIQSAYNWLVTNNAGNQKISHALTIFYLLIKCHSNSF